MQELPRIVYFLAGSAAPITVDVPTAVQLSDDTVTPDGLVEYLKVGVVEPSFCEPDTVTINGVAAGAAVTPVPEMGISSGLVGSLLVIDRVAERSPTATGEKRMVIVHWA